MSDVIFSDFDIGQPVETKTEKSKNRKIVLLKVFSVILATLILIEFILNKFIFPCMNYPVVTITGSSAQITAEVKNVLSSLNETSWLSFDTETAASSIMNQISAVESALVKKTFPDKVEIEIVEREIAAKSIVSIDGKTTGVQIDKNGVIFTTKSFTDVSSDNSIPLISGLPVEYVKIGMRLPSKYRPLMEQIFELKNLPQNYFAEVSEIQVMPKEYGNYELVFYPVHSRVRVLTDRSLNEEALKYMIVMLDVVNSMEPDVAEIDLRYDSVSYRKR
ncbi:MAG: FtsQ-type POTRA domain-containing protein [Treponema sp.]|nr:FtsQ-type POTRA domain-containing protein [Spirochaetia bacterium]MDY4902981.1 FtsQ-type POTRA domain-containing protein [Treponema sp.]